MSESAWTSAYLAHMRPRPALDTTADVRVQYMLGWRKDHNYTDTGKKQNWGGLKEETKSTVERTVRGSAVFLKLPVPISIGLVTLLVLKSTSLLSQVFTTCSQEVCFVFTNHQPKLPTKSKSKNTTIHGRRREGVSNLKRNISTRSMKRKMRLITVPARSWHRFILL
jgi:hypothetical protein